jgi:hypothetical protein
VLESSSSLVDLSLFKSAWAGFSAVFTLPLGRTNNLNSVLNSHFYSSFFSGVAIIDQKFVNL